MEELEDDWPLTPAAAPLIGSASFVAAAEDGDEKVEDVEAWLWLAGEEEEIAAVASGAILAELLRVPGRELLLLLLGIVIATELNWRC